MPKAKKSRSRQVDAEPGNEGETSLAAAYFNALTSLSVEASETETQRRGPKGYFTGSRKVLLEGKLPAYLATKKGNRHGFWHELYSSWWERYPWKLADNQEPPTDSPDEMADLALVEPGEECAKALVEAKLKEASQFFAFANRS
jgi:hypothetical protein